MNLVARDQAVIWHPYTQIGCEAPPIAISHGEGARLYDENGTAYLDAASSWWVSIHGHGNKEIAESIAAQARTLEQVIFAGFTHRPAVELAERLLAHLPQNQKRIFYSDNGSCAVEVALKMAVQYWHNLGTPRTRILSFEGGYHGDTIGAMSVAKGVFSTPFKDLLFESAQISLPVDDASLTRALSEIEEHKACGPIAAFIYEPLIQGVAGMRCYSAENLSRVLTQLRNTGALLIADEVMTGFFRCGPIFASNIIEPLPDIVCLSKGLSGGAMAFGATTATAEIFNAFVSTDRHKMLLHGHSFSGNPLACAAALQSLTILERSETSRAISRIADQQQQFATQLRGQGIGGNPRALGTIFACDLVRRDEKASYYSSMREEIIRYALSRGVILRPLGNCLYTMPPYVMSAEELNRVQLVISDLITSVA